MKVRTEEDYLWEDNNPGYERFIDDYGFDADFSSIQPKPIDGEEDYE